MRHLRLAIVVLGLAAPAAFAAQAEGATFTVNTTADNAAVAGECSGVAADCSLRQAVDRANSASPPTTISVPANSYFLSNGPLTITQTMNITGASAMRTEIFQETSTSTSRVFDILANANSGFAPTVSISGLAMFFGKADSTNGFFGGDVRNQGTLTLSEDVIADGSTTSGSGGGISNDGGTLTVTHSLVASNSSTYTSNSGGDSGGIQNFGPNPVTGTAGTLSVDNSTIANNNAALGGGIFSWGDGANTTSIVNSTLAYNSVDNTRGSTNGAGVLVSQGTLSLTNSIVAFNTVATPSAGTQANCGGTGIFSAGHNLESGTDCGFKSTGDKQSTDPLFLTGGAQNNGGNTETFALAANSPAVDAIPSTAAGCSGTDQRDVARPQGTGCDIGAYELFQPQEGTQFTEVIGVVSPESGTTPTIDWGDGSPQSNGSYNSTTRQVSGTHTYAEEGSYHGVVHYLNSDGGAQTFPFDVKVTDAPLSATPTSVNAGAGEPFSGPVATFTDSEPNGTASDYTATINWGDGTTSAGSVSGSSPFVVSGSHTYAAGGSYPVTVSIADVGGATATATGTATVAPQAAPALTPGAPAVRSTTSAAFTAAVNPEGLATAVVFQYGPALAGPGPALSPRAVAYTAATPAQTVGPDYSTHTVTATVTGLLPNTTYHFRALATNSAGGAVGPDQTLTTPRDPLPPPPVLGKSFDVQVVSGLVLVKLPHGQPLYATAFAALAAAASPGKGFLPLTEARRLPSGTQVDARLGKIKLTAATAKRGKTETGNFNGGLFGFAQNRRGANKGLTTLSLLEGAFSGAPTYASCKAKTAAAASSPAAHAAVSSQVLQTLHSRAHGRFRTRGRYAAATVRGTGWTTSDRCDGTLISVQLHAVEVTDFFRHITVLVHQGHSYLARTPTRRHK